MSFTIHGVGVSAGIAIGYAQLVSHATLEVTHYCVPPQHIPEEFKRFDAAIKATKLELEALRSQIPPNAPSELAAFLNTHLMILKDSSLSVVPKQIIESQRCNAEWALKQQMENLVAQFEKIEDSYLRERKTDVVQVVERVLKALLGHPSQIPAASSAEQSSILVAHDLSPAELILFKRHQFAGFITDVGSSASHTSILARSLNIPSAVALHHARELVREQELLILDGGSGVVIVDPDKEILAEYRLRQEQYDIEKQKLRRLRSTRAATLDGTPIELQGNIELPDDVAQVRQNGGTGVGLFRTEFLFLNRSDLPSEDEQFEAYRSTLHRMRGQPVTIRTLDLAADKNLSSVVPSGANPALGLRSIRLCLNEPQMFNTQLRAILRASRFGKVRILLPMISALLEVRQSLLLIEEAKRSLRDEKIAFDADVEVGAMVETPAAALSVPALAKHLDFLSIGTNDLIQYTLAIDRADDSVAYLYDPFHPAVLQLVARVIREATKAGAAVSVCGEMASDPRMTRLLLAFGLREFSMHPAHLLEVKQQVLKSNVPLLKPLAAKVLKCERSEKVHALLDQFNA
ncbi:MAG: phosphoenolpyruvate--protein phosphotransferase [Burkholderiales bacterium]